MCLEGFCENMPARDKAYSGLKDRECLYSVTQNRTGVQKLPDYSMRPHEKSGRHS